MTGPRTSTHQGQAMKTEQELRARLTAIIGPLGWSGPSGGGWWSIHAGRLGPLLSRTEQAEAERDEALAGVAQALKQNEGLQDLLKERDAEMARLRAAMQKAVDQIAHLYENRARLTLEVALDAELSHQGGKA
jgi:hypothetical protein